MTAIPYDIGASLLLAAKIVAVALIGYLAGIFLEKFVKRNVERIALSGLFKSAGMTQAAVERGVSIVAGEVIGKAIKYTLYLVVIILIFDLMGVTIVRDMLIGLLAYINNITVAFLILVVGAMLAEILSSMAGFSAREFDKLFKEAGGGFAPSYLISFVIKYLIYLISITIALTQLGFQTMLLIIIVSGAIIVITIFTFALIWSGLKDMAPDILSGIFIRNSRFVKLGESIEIDEFRGKVKRIGLLATEIKGKNETLKIQNSRIVKEVKIKYTL